jgi:hypothetical protein
MDGVGPHLVELHYIHDIIDNKLDSIEMNKTWCHQYMVEIEIHILGGMSYIRRCGYVNGIIGIYHDDGLNTWIKFDIMDEIKIFDEVEFIINCIHMVYFILHVINFVHIIIITHFH